MSRVLSLFLTALLLLLPISFAGFFGPTDYGVGFISNPVTFTPEDLGSKMIVWLDPSDATTVTTSGGRITGITDKSGTGNDWAEESSKGPDLASSAVNGLDAMDFDASNGEYLRSTNTNLTIGFAAMVVVPHSEMVDAGNWVNYIGFLTERDAGTAAGIMLISHSGQKYLFESGVFGTDLSVDGTDGNDTDPVEQILVITGGDATPSVQGIPVIGSERSKASRYLDGYIGELIICDEDVTDDEKDDIEAYLINKWGAND